MGFSLCFTVGITLHIVYAQNSTQYAPVVESSNTLIGLVIVGITSATSIIIALANKGLLGKHSQEIATNAVMIADTAHAVGDSRQTIKDVAQVTYDTIKISNPEATAYADQKIAPVIDQASVKVSEYNDKLHKFEDIANKASNGGKKADPKIMEMKDDIPDRIVPS
jgi:hypothetical protein